MAASDIRPVLQHSLFKELSPIFRHFGLEGARAMGVALALSSILLLIPGRYQIEAQNARVVGNLDRNQG